MQFKKPAFCVLLVLSLAACETSTVGAGGFDRYDADRVGGKAAQPITPAGGRYATPAASARAARLPVLTRIPVYTVIGGDATMREVAETARKGNRGGLGGVTVPQARVSIAGHEMEARIVQVGSYTYLVADPVGAGLLFSSLPPDLLRGIQTDAARVTGCRADDGVYYRSSAEFVVPIKC